ncbi:hypothetical protein ETAA8_13210 [Anatilimnocola aggregata]|uniref:Uncharacterized protein n=1 Tax=Anatilimnocola aggregata TaxID=2528021 RepID=A0A517Y7S3_9BACT|nr:hypothetical protein ETAA8_13210 [Anatilimnocola aggregata]
MAWISESCTGRNSWPVWRQFFARIDQSSMPTQDNALLGIQNSAPRQTASDTSIEAASQNAVAPNFRQTAADNAAKESATLSDGRMSLKCGGHQKAYTALAC